MIKITKTLGYDYNTELDDVRKVKVALNKIGYYKTPTYGLTPYPDENLFLAIKKFQKDKNLKVDGVVKPNGETIARLNGELPKDIPGVKGHYICPECGGRHGGVYGDLCQWCTFK